MKQEIKKNTKQNIYDQLNEYCNDDYVPMHMPGAKRNTELFKMQNPYGLDITEIDGFDNMHHAEGIIKHGFEKCAALFGAEESLYLINGSSAGILSAICGATSKGDRVIVARNSHKSVYNALYLNELNPVYIYPKLLCNAGIYGEITVQDVKNMIKRYPDATAVIITSPTYEGIVSDIKEIAKLVHDNDMVLIVDEAHGAHFNFHKQFPESAVTCGADAVIQSIHKTLPAFTQTALLHLNGTKLDRNRVKRYWDMFQTTSPSYILMAGIDRCMQILQESGKTLFDSYVEKLMVLRQEIQKLNHFQLLKVDDPSKIVLLVSDGKKLYDILIKKYKIQLEMASVSYVIAMTSIGDTQEYYDRFLNALQELDKIWCDEVNAEFSCSICNADVVMNLYQAQNYTAQKCICNTCNGNTQYLDLEQSINQISASSICFYPPGIPLVNPGERITKKIVDIIKKGIECNLEVIGLEYRGEEIKILCLK